MIQPAWLMNKRTLQERHELHIHMYHFVRRTTCSSTSLITDSCTSKPEFSASVFGMTIIASAYASIPSFVRPLTVLLNFWRLLARAGAGPKTKINGDIDRLPAYQALLSIRPGARDYLFKKNLTVNGSNDYTAPLRALPSRGSGWKWHICLPKNPSTRDITFSQRATN